jgi:hypothetical protein
MVNFLSCIFLKFRFGAGNKNKCIDFIQNAHNRDWSNAKIIAFDCLQQIDMPYSDRLSLLQKRTVIKSSNINFTLEIPSKHSVITVANGVECTGGYHLDKYTREICENRPVDQRAEGVVLRKPTAWYYEQNSFFQHTVSKSLFKYNWNLLLLAP